MLFSCSQLGSKAEGPGVVVDVISHEGGDHVVGVIVQRLHPHLAGIPGLCCSCCEVLRLELVVKEPIIGSLVNQDAGLGSIVVLHKLSRIVGLPSVNRTKIPSEGLGVLIIIAWTILIE